MGKRIDEKIIAASIESEVKDAVGRLACSPVILSLELCSTPDVPPIEAACSRAGISLDRSKISSEKISDLVTRANGDDSVAGIYLRLCQSCRCGIFGMGSGP